MSYEPSERDAQVAVAVEWSLAIRLLSSVAGSQYAARDQREIAELICVAKEIERSLYDQIDA